MNPPRLSWETISCLSDQIFNANHLNFTGYGDSTLVVLGKARQKDRKGRKERLGRAAGSRSAFCTGRRRTRQKQNMIWERERERVRVGGSWVTGAVEYMQAGVQHNLRKTFRRKQEEQQQEQWEVAIVVELVSTPPVWKKLLPFCPLPSLPCSLACHDRMWSTSGDNWPTARPFHHLVELVWATPFPDHPRYFWLGFEAARRDFRCGKLVWVLGFAYSDEESWRQGKYYRISVGHMKFPPTVIGETGVVIDEAVEFEK